MNSETPQTSVESEGHPKKLSWDRETLFLGVCFLLGTGVIVLAHLFHRHLYFRDYSIMWEGAYRLSLGQLPYLDFGIPFGPVSLILPASLFSIFGPGFDLLGVASILLQVATLGCVMGMLRNFSLSRLGIAVGAFSFVFMHATQVKFIWYNTTAAGLQFASFFVLSLFVRQQTQPILSGVWAALCALTGFAVFLTKQDFGLMALAMISFVMTAQCVFQKDWRNLSIYSGVTAAFALIFVLLFQKTNLGYWFNLGQPPHINRSESLNLGKLFEEPEGLLAFSLIAAACGIVGLAKRDSWKKVFVFFALALGIALQSAITGLTSGLPYLTGFYGLVLLGPAIFFGLQQWSFKGWQVVASLLFVGGYWLTEPHLFPNSRDLQAYTKERGVSNFLSERIGTDVLPEGLRGRSLPPGEGDRGLVTGRSVGLPEFGRQYLYPEVWERLLEVKELFFSEPLQKSLSSLPNPQCGVLNMTELTPMSQVLGLTPCVNYPLWYHPDVSIFHDERFHIQDSVQKERFALVLIQMTHQAPSPWYLDVIKDLDNQYQKFSEFHAAASHDPVRVYVRRGVLSGEKKDEL